MGLGCGRVGQTDLDVHRAGRHRIEPGVVLPLQHAGELRRPLEKPDPGDPCLEIGNRRGAVLRPKRRQGDEDHEQQRAAGLHAVSSSLIRTRMAYFTRPHSVSMPSAFRIEWRWNVTVGGVTPISAAMSAVRLPSPMRWTMRRCRGVSWAMPTAMPGGYGRPIPCRGIRSER